MLEKGRMTLSKGQMPWAKMMGVADLLGFLQPIEIYRLSGVLEVRKIYGRMEWWNTGIMGSKNGRNLT